MLHANWPTFLGNSILRGLTKNALLEASELVHENRIHPAISKETLIIKIGAETFDPESFIPNTPSTKILRSWGGL